MNKKIINITIIILILLVFTTSTYAYIINMDFWRESRLQQSPHHADGTQYIPSASQFIQNGCGTGTVLDHEHGLCWDANGTRFGTSTWAQAHIDCEGLTLAGRDWRLPTINELLTLVRDEDDVGSGTHLESLVVGFDNFDDGWYWTGDIRASNPSYAWRVSLYGGYVYGDGISYASLGVVCVSRN